MFAVIRVRGTIKVNVRMVRTLALLNLNRVNRLTLVREDEQSKKMLRKAENYITWGEIRMETLAKLLEKRGQSSIKQKLSAETLKELKVNSFAELAEKIMQGKSAREFGLKPFFALKPPSKGYERAGIKKPYAIGGALGYRGKEINTLIERMI
ncbi:MAG: 50S ribosomal protein L30 [Candidatus Diapherotrites archaeon]|nr:50S ribosomal protein L30 [Candidatus Diapherotrites archaeon]